MFIPIDKVPNKINKAKMKMKNAIIILLGIFSMVIVFHVCVLTKIIPFDIAWGGRLKNNSELYVFETISIFVNLTLIATLLIKGGYVKFQIKEKVINIILWVFFFIFIINTIGNIFAKTNFEKLFSVLTLISAILIWNILRKKGNTNS